MLASCHKDGTWSGLDTFATAYNNLHECAGLFSSSLGEVEVRKRGVDSVGCPMVWCGVSDY